MFLKAVYTLLVLWCMNKCLFAVSICPGPTFASSLNGTVTSPNYPGAYGNNLDCYYYIPYAAGFNTTINIDTFVTQGFNYDYLIISTSNKSIGDASGYVYYTNLTGSSGSPLNYSFQSNVRLYFHTDGSGTSTGFHLTWSTSPDFVISPSESSECQGPDVLFLLDNSQAIFQGFFNNDIKTFIAKVTARYFFADDITSQRPFSSRFGVIVFSDTATVSVPLKNYSRWEFLNNVFNNATFGDGGSSNVTAALSLAYDEFLQHGTPDHSTFDASRIIVLIVNDISPFRLNQTVAAMKHLKTVVQLPIGVIVPGVSGIPSEAQTRLTNLIGSSNYTFPSLDAAEIGIPALSSLKFPCPICSNLIFICETTAAIGYEVKVRCLKLAQRLAAATSKNSKQKYGIGIYGTQIYNNLTVQSFDDFNVTISALIDNVVNNNLPDGRVTYLAPILNQLYTMMGTDISSGNYAVMLMAQITSIQDPAQAVTAVRNLASRNADIYVIDESHSALPSNLWGILTQNQPYHVINGTVMTDIDELFITFDATLLQDFSNMHC